MTADRWDDEVRDRIWRLLHLYARGVISAAYYDRHARAARSTKKGTAA